MGLSAPCCCQLLVTHTCMAWSAQSAHCCCHPCWRVTSQLSQTVIVFFVLRHSCIIKITDSVEESLDDTELLMDPCLLANSSVSLY